jgi:hypothetical protein
MSIIPIRLRDREILDAQLVRCRQIDNSFTQGAAAGLRWLTAGGPGPLTGTLATLIDFKSVVHELAAAETIIYGPPSSGRDYARGLEHALLWAENATAGHLCPIPIDRSGWGTGGSPFHRRSYAPERHPPAGRPACRRQRRGTSRRRSPRRHRPHGAPPPVAPTAGKGAGHRDVRRLSRSHLAQERGEKGA